MFARTIAATALTGLALAPMALSAKPEAEPFTLTLSAQPNPVVFSTPATATGKLAGTDPGGVTVSLEADTTIPLGDKFTPTGDKATTAPDGSYSIAIAPSVNTQYRAVAKTKPAAESPVMLVKVRPRVDVTVSDRTPAAGARVTFAGAVLPERDGASSLVQRRKSGGWKTVAKAPLTDAGAEQSAYTKAVRIRRDGTYRVKVPKDAEHVAGFSRKLKLNVS